MFSISFFEYVDLIRGIENAYNIAINENHSLDTVLENLKEKKLKLEAVLTGDVAQVTKPIMSLRREQPTYVVMTDEGKNFINQNKDKFRKNYGDDWEEILNCVAYKLYG